MKTLGLAFTGDAQTSASVTIEWRSDVAFIHTPTMPVYDEDAFESLCAADWAAIGAPFGFPVSFTHAVGSWELMSSWQEAHTNRYMLVRLTEEAVRELVQFETGQLLSVPSVPGTALCHRAIRCAELLDTFESEGAWDWKLNRVGIPHAKTTGELPEKPEKGIIEGYAPASLAVWGMPFRGYRKDDAKAVNLRADIVTALIEKCPALVISDRLRRVLAARPEFIDALALALTARAAADRRTHLPEDDEDMATADMEGWIHVPHSDVLTYFCEAGNVPAREQRSS